MTNEQETSFTPGEIEQLKQLEGVELFAFISALKEKRAADPQPSTPMNKVMTNEQEVLELFEISGAKATDFYLRTGEMVFEIDASKVVAFVAAIKEKHSEELRRQVAMLVGESRRLRKAISDMSGMSENNELLLLANSALTNVYALSATQQAAAAYEAEVGARAMEEAADNWTYTIPLLPDEIRTVLRNLANEKRKQTELRTSAAKPEGKE